MQLRPDRKINDSGATDIVYGMVIGEDLGKQKEGNKKIVSNTEQDKQMTVNFLQSRKDGAIHKVSERTGAGSPQAGISPLFTSYLGYYAILFPLISPIHR